MSHGIDKSITSLEDSSKSKMEELRKNSTFGESEYERIRKIPATSRYQEDEDKKFNIITYKYEKLAIDDNIVYRENKDSEEYDEVGRIYGSKPYDIEFNKDIIQLSQDSEKYDLLFRDFMSFNKRPSDKYYDYIVREMKKIKEIFSNELTRLNFILDVITRNYSEIKHETIDLLFELYRKTRCPVEELIIILIKYGGCKKADFRKDDIAKLDIFYPLYEGFQIALNINKFPFIIHLLLIEPNFAISLIREEDKDKVEKEWIRYYKNINYRYILVLGEDRFNQIFIKDFKIIMKILSQKSKDLLFSMYKEPHNIDILKSLYNGNSEYTKVELFSVKEITLDEVPNLRLVVFSDKPNSVYKLLPVWTTENKFIKSLEYLGEFDSDTKNLKNFYKNTALDKIKQYLLNLELEDYDDYLVQYDDSTLYEKFNKGDDVLYSFTRTEKEETYKFKGVITNINPLEIDLLEQIDYDDIKVYKAGDNIYNLEEGDYKLIGRVVRENPIQIKLFSKLRINEKEQDDLYIIPGLSYVYKINKHNKYSYDFVGTFNLKEGFKYFDEETMKLTKLDRKIKIRNIEKERYMPQGYMGRYSQVSYDYSKENSDKTSYGNAELLRLVDRVKEENLSDAKIDRLINEILIEVRKRDEYISRKFLEEIRQQIEDIKVEKGISESYTPVSPKVAPPPAPKPAPQAIGSIAPPTAPVSHIPNYLYSPEKRESPKPSYYVGKVEEEEAPDEVDMSLFNYNNNQYGYLKDSDDVYKHVEGGEEGEFYEDPVGSIINRTPLTIKFNNGSTIKVEGDIGTLIQDSSSVVGEQESESDEESVDITIFNYDNNQYGYLKDSDDVYKHIKGGEEGDFYEDPIGIVTSRNPLTIKLNNGTTIQVEGDKGTLVQTSQPANANVNVEIPTISYKGITYIYFNDRIYQEVAGSNIPVEVGKVITKDPLNIELYSEKKSVENVGAHEEPNSNSNSDFTQFEYKGDIYVYTSDLSVYKHIKGTENDFEEDPVGILINTKPITINFNNGKIINIEEKEEPLQVKKESPKKEIIKKEPAKYRKDLKLTEYKVGKKIYGYTDDGVVYRKFRSNYIAEPQGQVISLEPFVVEYFEVKGRKITSEANVDEESQAESSISGSQEQVVKVNVSKPKKEKIPTQKNANVDWKDEYNDLEPVTYKGIDYMINPETKHVFEPNDDDEFDYVGNIINMKPLKIELFEKPKAAEKNVEKALAKVVTKVDQSEISKKYGGLFIVNDKNEVFNKTKQLVGFWNEGEQEIHFIPLRAFTNENNSCYINTVLFALLYRENPFIQRHILTKDLTKLFSDLNVTKQDVQDAITNNQGELIRLNNWLHDKEQEANTKFVCKPFRKLFRHVYLDGSHSQKHMDEFETQMGETEKFLGNLLEGFGIKTIKYNHITIGEKSDGTKKELSNITELIAPIIPVQPGMPNDTLFNRQIEEKLDFTVLADMSEEDKRELQSITNGKLIIEIKILLDFLKTKTRIRKDEKAQLIIDFTKLEGSYKKNKYIDIKSELTAIYNRLKSVIEKKEIATIEGMKNINTELSIAKQAEDEIKEQYAEYFSKKSETIQYNFYEGNDDIDNNYLALWVDRTKVMGSAITKSKDKFDIQKTIELNDSKLDLQFVIKHMDSPKHFVCYFKNIKDGLWYLYNDVNRTFTIVKQGDNIGTFGAMKSVTENDCVLLFYSK